ncbi:Gfo/Idh/MocA family protein [Paenibacillus agricola]|uniref:Gfo/Idh/MocA family oxidoreductase n=1 Tax=Paenibacillus agricola TaxID=2716264 RepID=A0ABX0J266_9BACL|nr:Gfo/Idh/MocA family oxidoreductase [Paenibacillus agricola]NHN30344.1 Gfo/Idh/MocA family oxidoreductase [Paenibacillus agricola]
MNFAIIGTGMISHIHAEVIQSLDGHHLTWVHSRNERYGADFARKYGCKHSTDLEMLLMASDIDAVAICTPSGTHAELIIQAAQHHKHVLVEKPLDIALEQADEAIQVCKENGVKLGVIFQLRFMEETKKAKRILEEGLLGALIEVDTYMKFYRPETYYENSSWKGKQELDGGGALMNQGIHGIDLLLWLAGSVSSVTAQVKTLKHAIEVEDTAAAIVNFANGAMGIIQGTTSIYPDHPQLLTFHGTKGTLELAGTEVPYIRTLHIQDRPELTINHPAVPVDHLGEAHKQQYIDFIEAIEQDRQPLVNGAEGRKSLQLVKSIYQSSLERRTVEVPQR